MTAVTSICLAAQPGRSYHLTDMQRVRELAAAARKEMQQVMQSYHLEKNIKQKIAQRRWIDQYRVIKSLALFGGK